ncbi:Uncharacterized protein FWK35_00014343 [Aphis craccivora]|uniref:Uncharacterized protein n=1 Tax=Aphis craccivora TaxID=307492 RepID=A0A6G0YRP8_APHCR|nr:Uncharacterized protein FWK35_00014343 [Aphis craccivora]
MTSITSRNTAPISNYGGGFRCKSEYPLCIIQVKSKHFPTVFKKIEKNKKKKMTEKREFLRNSILCGKGGKTVVGIHFSFWLCRGYAPGGRHFWEFPLFHPALWGLPLYRLLDGKKTLSNASTVVENQTFGAGVTKYQFSTKSIFFIWL